MNIEALAQEAGFKLASGSNWTNVAGTDDNLQRLAQLMAGEDRRDAERYRWIKATLARGEPRMDGKRYWINATHFPASATFDEAIDLAMAERPNA